MKTPSLSVAAFGRTRLTFRSQQERGCVPPARGQLSLTHPFMGVVFAGMLLRQPVHRFQATPQTTPKAFEAAHSPHPTAFPTVSAPGRSATRPGERTRPRVLRLAPRQPVRPHFSAVAPRLLRRSRSIGPKNTVAFCTTPAERSAAGALDSGRARFARIFCGYSPTPTTHATHSTPNTCEIPCGYFCGYSLKKRGEGSLRPTIRNSRHPISALQTSKPSFSWRRTSNSRHIVVPQAVLLPIAVGHATIHPVQNDGRTLLPLPIRCGRGLG